MHMLQVESELDEIVRLVGIDALGFTDRLMLEATRSIREDYLHQNAFHEIDTYTSLKKQFLLLKLIIQYYELGLRAIGADASFSALASLPVREAIGRFKYIPEDETEESYKRISAQLEKEMRELSDGGEEDA